LFAGNIKQTLILNVYIYSERHKLARLYCR